MKEIKKWDGQSIEQLQEILDAQKDCLEDTMEKHDAFVLHCAKQHAMMTLMLDSVLNLAKETAKMTAKTTAIVLDKVVGLDAKDKEKLREELDDLFKDEDEDKKEEEDSPATDDKLKEFIESLFSKAEDDEEEEEIELDVPDEKMDAILTAIFGITRGTDEDNE